MSAFLPITEADDHHSLTFADIRFFGKGEDQAQQLSANLGYRHLFSGRHMFGAYTYVDALAEKGRHSFSRIGLGAEYQNNRLFIKGSVFTPLGDTREDRVLYDHVPSFPTFASYMLSFGPIERTKLIATEVALRGAEGDIGYAITDRLNIQAGGYATIEEYPGFGRSALYTGLAYKVGDGLSVQARGYFAKHEGNALDVGISYNLPPPTPLISNANIGVGYEYSDNQEGRAFAKLSFDLGSPVKSAPALIMDRGMTAHISRTVPITAIEKAVTAEQLSEEEELALFEKIVRENSLEIATYALYILVGFRDPTFWLLGVLAFLNNARMSPTLPVIPDYKVRPGPFANKQFPEMSYNSQEEKEEK